MSDAEIIEETTPKPPVRSFIVECKDGGSADCLAHVLRYLNYQKSKEIRIYPVTDHPNRRHIIVELDYT